MNKLVFLFAALALAAISITLNALLITWTWNHFVAATYTNLKVSMGPVVGILLLYDLVVTKIKPREVDFDVLMDVTNKMIAKIIGGALLVGLLAIFF